MKNETPITLFDACCVLELAGAFCVSKIHKKMFLFRRRGKSQSGDIDALVTHPSLELQEEKKKQSEKILKTVVRALDDLITDVISMGDTKFMVIQIIVSSIVPTVPTTTFISYTDVHAQKSYF